MATKSASKSSKEPQTMAELLALSENKVKGLLPGQKLKAVVLAKNPKSLVLDIGGKAEGLVTERAFQEARDFIKTLKVGDEVNAMVLISETRDGNPILSLRQAAYDAAWGRLEKAREDQSEVAVVGRNVTPAGVAVEVEGMTGFIPSSQLGKHLSGNTQELTGKYFKTKVVELDRSTNKIVLSEKAVSEASDIKAAKEALEALKEGEVYEGVVTTVAGFGCFVKLDIPSKKDVNVEGLVHISELSWGKVDNIHDEVKSGDRVKVRILGMKDGKLSLSVKHALEDPWKKAEKKYPVDTKHSGVVKRITDFGVFVELEPGIEGLIHLTNIPPATKLTEGKEVQVNVQEMDANARKISLGLVLTAKPLGYK